MYTSATETTRFDAATYRSSALQTPRNDYGIPAPPSPEDAVTEQRFAGSERKRDRHAAIVWAGIAAFCIFFAVVYNHFGHGVQSPYMNLLFLYPLIGGTALFAALAAIGRGSFTRLSYNAWNAGIATLATGSVLHGIFAIAGTSSAFQPVYTSVGIALLAFALLATIVSRLRRRGR